MNKFFSLVTALCVSAVTSVFGQEARPFAVAPQYPTDGAEVTITYNPSLTSLAGSEEITGVIYCCDGEEWTADDLTITEGGDGTWTAHYTVPAGSVLFACKFYGDGGEWDSGDSALGSYGMFVYATGDAGQPIRKQYTWMQRSLLFSKSLDKYAVPGWLREEFREDDQRTLDVIKQELLSHPQSAPELLYYVYTLMAKLQPLEDFEPQMRSDFEALMADPATPELTLIRAAELARSILRDQALTERIEAATLANYPDGLLARDREIHKVFHETDPAVQLALLNEFVERFPPRNFTVPRTPVAAAFYYRLYWTVLRNAPAERFTPELLAKYLPMMTYPDVMETFYRAVYLPHDKKLKTSAELLPYSEELYAELIKRMNGPEDRYYAADRNRRYSPAQWRETMAGVQSNADAILAHAQILMETGSAARALEIAESIRTKMERSSKFNETYASLLSLNGHGNIPFIEQSVRLDAATPAMIEQLREAYRGDDFDAYFVGLRSEEHAAAMGAKLLAQMIDTPVEPFRLENTRGEWVDMKELKGKVIVLDFWATWCMPCMAAMPGMKMAKDMYKDNPDVLFYFVDTMEYDDKFKEYVPRVMEQRGFSDLEVLYDGINERGRQGTLFNLYGKTFEMHGIPQKMIIDGKGNVRWVSTGYAGNPLGLANEISFIVDTLLAE